jgi:hypothetical protein
MQKEPKNRYSALSRYVFPNTWLHNNLGDSVGSLVDTVEVL